MCSIFGAVGTDIDLDLLDSIREHARDRGRDGGNMVRYALRDGHAFLGNWRATPTPEVEVGPLQPYNGLVHNGTIANDRDLGGHEGEIDSQVLSRVLDRTNLSSFRDSLARVVGSYALAVVNQETVLAAVNYKPLHFWAPSGAGEAVYFSSMERHLLPYMPYGQRPVQVPPYSVIDLRTGESLELPRNYEQRAVVICSAGLDSTTVATMLVRQGFQVCLLHFRYGCRAQTREAALIPRLAVELGASYEILDLPYTKLSGGSPLLDQAKDIAGSIEGAEYAHEWVPARNLVLMSIASAFAEANGFHVIALGNNLEESGSYPDNEEQMTILLDRVMDYAVQNGYNLRVTQPVGHLMKHEIVALGLKLGAPYRHTWSCYEGGDRHCGRCGPCFMRKTAFERNGTQDPVFAESP
jgi:7-cyano-7-deazaguanine synthase